MATPGTSLDPSVWDTSVDRKGNTLGKCKICRQADFKAYRRCLEHENSSKHKSALAYTRSSQTKHEEHIQFSLPATSSEHAATQALSSKASRAVSNFLSTLHSRSVSAAGGESAESPTPAINDLPNPAPIDDEAPEFHLPETNPGFLEEPHMGGYDADWLSFEVFSKNTVLQDSHKNRTIDAMERQMAEWNDGQAAQIPDHLSDHMNTPHEVDHSSDPTPNDGETQPDGSSFTLHPHSMAEPAAKRARMMQPADESNPWYPWPDRISCTIDLFTHLPRSVFSQNQQDLLNWILTVNGVQDVPSLSQAKKLNEYLQKSYGIRTIRYNGALGHVYYVNDLCQIIAQEMANPKVRPHLRFYPEDTGNSVLGEASQAARWLHEAPDELLTPMVRLPTGDFFIHEPAMLRDGTLCMPVRWFEREGAMYAKCWQMQPVTTETLEGWRVIKPRTPVITPASDFMKNYPELKHDYGRFYSGPDVTQLYEFYDEEQQQVVEWTYTQWDIGNKWRVAAKGHRVLGVPLWLYCDDTSGNLSKKWNKHNSFLFTAAGLPRAEAHKEYNVHFLSTSNLAPPLEMMDGVVDQLENAQTEGVWAWDCVYNEPVLVILWILALLGDNPMQSEFACHIGLRGRLFCRVCKVEGKQQSKGKEGRDRDDDGGGQSEAGDDASDSGSVTSADSIEESVQVPSKGRRQIKETFDDMFRRIQNFIKPGPPRSKQETMVELQSMFAQAQKIGTATSLKTRKTQTGLKDTFQEHFLAALAKSHKKKRGHADKQAALNEAWSQLPSNTSSPVWRIKGLDPHLDTPVEILHVILLGFLKYLWRDLIQNQLKNKDDKKELLITRLESLNVSGLGIPQIAGRTLVQFAGSLTGRDFRVITQVAPFVIYDLVPAECYATWLSLSRLVPMIWQPVIDDPTTYIAELETEISNFLLSTARWTCQWFNKPKFHILVHLPEHIRRFGPAMLFATEAFESYNSIIRAKSLHSNRHAPSKDIGIAFAQGNRVRHLTSESLFRRQTETENTLVQPYQLTVDSWTSVGPGVVQLLRQRSPVTHYLGLNSSEVTVQPGSYVSTGKQHSHFLGTETGQRTPETILVSDDGKVNGKFMTGRQLVLGNNDVCHTGNFVVYEHGSTHIPVLRVGRVQEILVQVGSRSALLGEPSAILVHQFHVLPGFDTRYLMPRLRPADVNDPTTPAFVTLPWTRLLCTVNVQHNCHAHQCTSSQSRPIYQERERTTQVRPVTGHVNTSDLILNVAQMRDAMLILRFREPSETLSLLSSQILRQSADKEQAKNKAVRSTLSQTQSHTMPPALHPRVSALQQAQASSSRRINNML